MINKGVNMYYCKEKLCYDAILKLYQKGCKEEQNIGFEYERIPVNKETYETVSS